MSLQRLKREGESDIRASPFTFNDVLRALGDPTARTLIVTLVPAQEFSASDPTEASSMLDQPAFPTERKLPHRSFAGIPIDRSDQLGSEAVFPVPVSLRFFCESKGIQLFLVDLRKLFLIDPQRPFFESEL